MEVSEQMMAQEKSKINPNAASMIKRTCRICWESEDKVTIRKAACSNNNDPCLSDVCVRCLPTIDKCIICRKGVMKFIWLTRYLRKKCHEIYTINTSHLYNRHIAEGAWNLYEKYDFHAIFISFLKVKILYLIINQKSFQILN